MNELSQGNSMLHQMRDYNAGVDQHNAGIQSDFNQKITDAKEGLRKMGGQEYAENLTEKIGGGVGLQGVKAAKQVYSAYQVASGENGFSELGKLGKVGKVAGQTFADAPIGRGLAKVGEGAQSIGKSIASATNPFTTAKYVKTTFNADQSRIGLRAQPIEGAGFAPRGTGQASTTPSQMTARQPTASALGEEDDEPLFKSQTDAPVELRTRGPLGDPDAPTIAPKSAIGSVADDALQEERIGGALSKAGTMAEGLGTMAQGLGIVQGGVDAVKDLSSGHVAGANHEEKAGNILGMVGGALDLAGFFVPGLGLLGAAAGVASAVTGEIGQEQQAKKNITQTLPGEEKGQMSNYGPSAGATAESAGQVSSLQSTAQSKIGGGSSAF